MVELDGRSKSMKGKTWYLRYPERKPLWMEVKCNGEGAKGCVENFLRVGITQF